MSRSYPIWVDATNCNRKSGNVTYGYKKTGETDYYVGSSSKNSHKFVNTIITKRTGYLEDDTPVVRFSFSIDDFIVKQMIFSRDKNSELAKDLIETKYFNISNKSITKVN